MVDPEQPRFLSLLRDAWLLSPASWDGLRPGRGRWFWLDGQHGLRMLEDVESKIETIMNWNRP